jgi:uncharacterized protein YdeI (BOF family)|tara:strand:+ start:585 stop:980 length:396 start_codon:yes stop_codon:yes gene_type:complete
MEVKSLFSALILTGVLLSEASFAAGSVPPVDPSLITSTSSRALTIRDVSTESIENMVVIKGRLTHKRMYINDEPGYILAKIINDSDEVIENQRYDIEDFTKEDNVRFSGFELAIKTPSSDIKSILISHQKK